MKKLIVLFSAFIFSASLSLIALPDINQFMIDYNKFLSWNKILNSQLFSDHINKSTSNPDVKGMLNRIKTLRDSYSKYSHSDQLASFKRKSPSFNNRMSGAERGPQSINFNPAMLVLLPKLFTTNPKDALRIMNERLDTAQAALVKMQSYGSAN